MMMERENTHLSYVINEAVYVIKLDTKKTQRLNNQQKVKNYHMTRESANQEEISLIM